ncbi:MAG TPA: PilZ domain-containing protein [Candidatus Dormibacteraeota bacterium]|nr:PilZ domain-containing protein [Candidatus Dormibacteraeota bacterium]
MQLERRRTARYPFAATAEIIDEKANARTSASRVTDLSENGCYVEMMNPFPQGTGVLIEIHFETEFLEVHATVAYLEPKLGMGLTFNDMQPYSTSVLIKWLVKAHYSMFV